MITLIRGFITLVLLWAVTTEQIEPEDVLPINLTVQLIEQLVVACRKNKGGSSQ